LNVNELSILAILNSSLFILIKIPTPRTLRVGC
jgi:hypothetical protein